MASQDLVNQIQNEIAELGESDEDDEIKEFTDAKEQTQELIHQITKVRTKFDKKLAKQTSIIQQDVDLVLEIRTKVAAAVKKWQKQKDEIVEMLRTEVKYQVGLNVNQAIETMNSLKNYISADMKKWASQRSDLQIEIARTTAKLDRFKELLNGKMG